MFTDNLLAHFSGEYKTGRFGKKMETELSVLDEFIKGKGAEVFDGRLSERDFRLEYDEIRDIRKTTYEGSPCLMIEYVDNRAIVNENKVVTLIFPNLANPDEAVRMVASVKQKVQEERQRQWMEEQEAKERQEREAKQYMEDCRSFYNDCYQFHIAAKGNPVYELARGEMQFAGIYIDQEKNINFLKIDGNTKEENNACIRYDKIHYYEKAGSIHYTTDIKGSSTNFGGSISGGTVSTLAGIFGGLLFGPMGMAAGAMLTHKPAQMESPSTVFDISSEVHKIDDRSVILNYYSDAKQQLLDIELPSDIYNFLQTHLPEKRYGIVLEIERKDAVKHNQASAQGAIEGASVAAITQNDDMDLFERRIKKLKMMYENGILSEQEFTDEKKRLLSEL